MKPQHESYDVIVIGSGLAGMTAANVLGRSGHCVLLLERHYKLGGLATTFCRPGGHIFDISLHGFPVGMIKSCRRYWGTAISERIARLQSVRFDNPQFSLSTTFTREDFTQLLVERFGVAKERVTAFFDKARSMTHYDVQNLTTQQLFDEFFPGRADIVRLLMEPITYANGSTLEDPALTYGIVFSNFMSQGVFTFRGGTDLLIRLMRQTLKENGVDIVTQADVNKIVVENGHIQGVVVNGQTVRAKAVLSNANLKGTVFDLVGKSHFPADFAREAKAVRLNNSSTQVYIALNRGEKIDHGLCGDLLFTSTAPAFRTDLLLSRQITSRTYSFYYPTTRPDVLDQSDRHYIVASTNAHYDDWANLSPEKYSQEKTSLIDETLTHLEKYVPNVRRRVAHVEAATPVTFARYTSHWGGASFGTKYEGLAVSRALHTQIAGLFHAGSVGIIMSGWLGAVNYGVIAANDIEAFLMMS